MQTLIYIALLVISSVIAYINRPKPQRPTPVAFEDIDFPQFEEGTLVSVAFGTCWFSDWMLIGLGGYRTRAITKKVG